jgi:hypothetical protein
MIKHYESRYAATQALEEMGFKPLHHAENMVWFKRPFTASVHPVPGITHAVMVAISHKDGFAVTNYEVSLT